MPMIMLGFHPSQKNQTEKGKRMLRLPNTKKIENLFVFFSLIIFSGAFIFVLRPSQGNSNLADGDPFARRIYALIYLITFLFCILKWKTFIRFALKDKWLLLLLLFVCISGAWSEVPALTARRTIAIIGSTIFGIYFAMRFTIHEQIKLITAIVLVILFSSLLLTLFFPSYGIMTGVNAGSWQGVFSHKNLLGRFSVLAIVVAIFIWIIAPKWRLTAIIIVPMALLLLYQSNSAGALLILFGLGAIFPFIIAVKFPYRLAGMLHFGLLCLVVIGLIIISQHFGNLLALLGRNATLTGRLDLWPLVIDMIQERPFLGYGFSGFWRGENGPSYFVWINSKWASVPPHAHNGFLDLTLDLGIIGLAIYLMGFSVALFRAFQKTLFTQKYELFWPLIYLIFIFIANQSESTILRTNSFYWILYVTVCTTLANQKYKAYTKINPPIKTPSEFYVQ